MGNKNFSVLNKIPKPKGLFIKKCPLCNSRLNVSAIGIKGELYKQYYCNCNCNYTYDKIIRYL